MDLQTEYEFMLPRGFINPSGVVIREGRMRLALALDEIEAFHDVRVQENPAYLPVVLLSRVIVSFGDAVSVTPQVVEKFFAADLAYLEDLYLRLNGQESVIVRAICPHCNHQFRLRVAPLGNEPSAG